MVPVVYKLKGPENIEWSFSPEGGPIDETAGVTDDLFQTLGRAVASWARMEFLLDNILLHVNKKEASTDLYDEKHSRGFKQSIALLRRWKDHKNLIDQKVAVDTVLKHAEKLADHRNDFLHGHWKSYDPRKKEIALQRFQFEGKDIFHLREIIYTERELIVFGELCEDTKTLLMAIAEAVFQKPAG